MLGGASDSSQKKGLRIIIVGCGKVGRTLVDMLSQEGHDITVIDKDSAKINTLTNMYDIMGIEGNGASYSVQVSAGIDDADLLIAVTDSDELNLLCCTIAKRVGDCAAIARVRTPDYSKEVSYLQERLGLAMIINPELEAASEIARILAYPSALEVQSFAHGQAEMIEFKIPEGNLLDGVNIASLHGKIHTPILVCAVKKGDEVLIPKGDTVLNHGDKIYVVGATRFAKIFLKDIGIKARQVKDCIIVGGGKASYYLASSLIQSGIEVKLIERNRERCEELSTLLPKAVIINGDGSDENLLMEEGLEFAESFVPLTGIDEENILLTLYANQVSNAKVITKVNRINFDNVLNQLNLGSVIYPKYLTAESIVAYVRARSSASSEKHIETLYHMFDQKVEAIEFRVEEKSAVTGTTFMELKLKENLLVAFINRNGKIIIPKGSDLLKVGDTVMIVTTHKGFTNITDILR